MVRVVTGSVLVLALIATGSPGFAQQQQPQPSERYVSVSGEGTVEAVPDVAIIQTGVTTQAKTAQAASEANTAAMSQVLAAVKAAGIAERDVQTSQFSIRPLYDSRRDGNNRITGFQTTNRVSVKVRDLARLGAVLDRLITAGANEMSGIHFMVSNQSKVLDQARGDAVADARRKAELLAKAAGASLGKPIAIVEDGGSVPMPRERLAMRASPSAAVPIAVGEQTLRVNVSVTFELAN